MGRGSREKGKTLQELSQEGWPATFVLLTPMVSHAPCWLMCKVPDTLQGDVWGDKGLSIYSES